MKKLTATLCLTVALLLGSAEISVSGDWKKGYAAFKSGDYATAVREWTSLAEQGDAIAQYNLGWMYDEGQGVTQDYKTAVKWYRLAAEQGLADAQYNLGVTYHKGDGVPQNDKTAVRWWKLAAERGNTSAQNNLGSMYALGKGVTKDLVYAHMWLNIAAMNGDRTSAKLRNIVSKRITPAELSTAQKLARKCVQRKLKDCKRQNTLF